jgi:hypothetical protein
MKGGSFEKSNPIALGDIRSQQGEVTCIMAPGEENVLALTIIGKQAKHLSNLEVCALLLVARVDKIVQILRASEI